MENLNMYEEPPVASPVTMDALGNTNQDIYNNPFGDFNNQLISDVAIGKSTEITDLVMQQQPESAFCNLTDNLTNTLNNINNNKFNNGHDENNFMVDDDEYQQQQHQQLPQPAEQNVVDLNDDNNNSNNDNLGPETDVDATDEDFQFNVAGAVGGDKEKTQMEFKETEDVADRAEIMNFAADHSAAIYGTLENKIFEEMSLQNPDMKGNNPFEASDDFDPLTVIDEVVAPVEEFMDNKMIEEEMEQEIQQHADVFAEKIDNLQQDFQQDFQQGFGQVMDFMSEAVAGVEQELSSAHNDVEELAMEPQQQQQEQPEADLGFVESSQQAIGESGGEDSEDEWNYVKVVKKLSDGLAAVEEASEPTAESPIIEQREEETATFDDKQSDFDHFAASDKLEEGSEEDQEIQAIEREKEPALAAEERHVKDELEKDLQLSIETEDFDEMSQLNPDAKEFIPVSPTRSNGPMSPPLNGNMNPANPLLSNFVSEDALVSQSPRKGESPAMEDINVPTEKDFDIEAETRPHEINVFVENGGFQRVESPELLNLKESMQQDDKLEQEYKDEAQPSFEEEKKQIGDDYKVLESSFSEYSNGFQNIIDDPMNRSFYEGRDDADILAARSADVLNSVQPIPSFEDDQPEADKQIFNGDAPEADWNLISGAQEAAAGFGSQVANLLSSAPAAAMESSDNFEAERFVEEIKSAQSEFDKYVDQALSPTLPEFNLSTIQTVEQVSLVQEPSLEQVQDSFVVEASAPPQDELAKIEIPHLEFKEVAEVNEPPPTPATGFEEQPALTPQPELIMEKLTQEVEEEPKVEVLSQIAAGAAVVAAAAGIVAAKKKPAAAASKTEVKKTDVKAKAPIASKTNPIPSKRPTTTTTATKAPITKPLAAPAPAKPLAIKKTSASLTAAKPAVSSAPAARPKLPTSTVPPIKRPTTGSISKTASDSSAKPTPIARTTTLTKKPTAAVAATKPPARTTTTAVPSKPKLTNGTSIATERKPLSAPISRAPAKPTSLSMTAKPKPNGTSSTLKSSTKTMTTTVTRLSSSAAEKSATSPLKEKTLNRSAVTVTRSPRPTSAVTTKDLKSPAGAAPKASPSLSALGVKKPLSTVKRSPISTTTTTSTVTKKSPTKVSAIKKTTTVVQKKVVNGDIVSEQTTTTLTTSGDPQLIEDILKDGLASELNGHTNGNGIAENGAGDAIQMVLDSAAD